MYRKSRRDNPAFALAVALLMLTRGDAAGPSPGIISKNVSGAADDVGIVVVDVRANEAIGDGSAYILQWFQSMHITAPTLHIELWTGQTTRIAEKLQQHINARAPLISVRRMPLVDTQDDVPRGLDLNSGNGGHIGKAYALSHSAFGFPVLTDSDVYACNGWTEKLYETLNDHPKTDVLWTFANYPTPDAWRDDDAVVRSLSYNHVSKHIDSSSSELEEFSNFAERNSGTIIAVRRTAKTKAFLDDVLLIYSRLEKKGLTHSGDIQKFIGSANEKIGHDQGAFREAFFIHRHEITEHVMSSGRNAVKKHAWACRPPSHRHMKVSQCGACSRPCFLVHNKACVRILTKRYRAAYGQPSNTSTQY